MSQEIKQVGTGVLSAMPKLRIAIKPPAAAAPPPSSRARYAEFLPDLEAIAEREHSPYARQLSIWTALLFAVAIGWAAIAEVDQVATAPGSVRPAGKVKIVNHPDGGAVGVLLVHEGDRVAEGAKLAELDARAVDQELSRLTGEWQALGAEIARIEAELANKEPAFDPTLAEARPDLTREQTSQYVEDRKALESRRGAAAEKVLQARSALGALEKKEIQLVEGVKVSREQERVLSELTGQGYFPKLKYLGVKRQLTDDEGQLAQVREEIKRARAAMAEAEREQEQTDADYYAKLLERQAQARIEHQRAFRGMNQQAAKRASLVITAPVSGIVQNLIVASAGQAVRAGEPVMNIVPTGATLVIEAKVSNNDIGYITIGQSATVKIDTYPYVKFGTLDGTVEGIAADASKDEKTGQAYFNVYVRTARAYLGGTPSDQPVNPGMQASVDLHIGKRTVLAYLTDRFRQKASNILREP